MGKKIRGTCIGRLLHVQRDINVRTDVQNCLTCPERCACKCKDGCREKLTKCKGRSHIVFVTQCTEMAREWDKFAQTHKECASKLVKREDALQSSV